MRNTIKIFLVLAFLAAAVGCRKDEIDLFGEQRYIYFNTIEGEHELHYSFLYSHGEDEVTVSIPMGYSGRLYGEDAEYAIAVDAENTTAVAGDEYELPSEFVFKGNSYTDTLKIILRNSSRLSTEEQRLSIRLVTNDSFVAAIRDSLVMDIYMANIISKPAWWTDAVTEAYLGTYSDTKLQLFIDNIYSGDYGELAEDEKLYYARLFKYWLDANPSYDEYGRITVPVIG